MKNIFTIILLFLSFNLLAQRPVPIYNCCGNNIYANFEKVQLDSLYEFYSLEIDPSYELINGKAYFPYYFRSQLKPILYNDRNHSSSVILKGIKYNNVELEYDTYKDEIIYIDSGRFCIYTPLMVALNKDNIDYFEFYYSEDTLSFRYLCKNSDPSFNLQDGFYEVVSNCGTKYIIKHSSLFDDLVGIDEYTYIQVSYVNIGNGFSAVTTKRRFLKIFGDRSDEVRKYIEQSGIKIRKANKEQIKSVLKYYDSLSNQI